mgnify:CR=1 FL=1
MTRLDEIPLYKILYFFDKLPQSYFFSSKSLHNVVLIRINMYVPRIDKKVPFLFLRRKGKLGLEPVRYEMLKRFEREFEVTNNKLCKFSINKTYTKSGYLDSDISIVLFNDTRKSKRSTISKYTFGQTIYGILFLEEDRSDEYTFYLNLICSKKGIGSLLLKLCETIGTYFDYDKIGLSSVDDPMSFYIYKKYFFKKGRKRFEIRNDIDIDPYEMDSGRLVLKKALKRVGYFTRNGYNTKISDIPKAIGTRRLSRKVKRSLKRVGALRNISLNSDGNVKMFKKVQYHDKEDLDRIIGEYSEDNFELYQAIELSSYEFFIDRKYKKKHRSMLKRLIRKKIKSRKRTKKPKTALKTKTTNTNNGWETVTNNN